MNSIRPPEGEEELPLVAVVILNWNGWRDTVECLRSLDQLEYWNCRIILLDNGSSDESVRMIEQYIETKKLRVIRSSFSSSHSQIGPLKISESEGELETATRVSAPEFEERGNRAIWLIRCDKNHGFAEGNNIAIRLAYRSFSPDYFLLLNNDTVVDSDLLNKLVGAAESDSTIGFTGPKVLCYSHNRSEDIISSAGGRVEIAKGRATKIGFGEVDNGQYDYSKDVDYIEGSCILVRASMLPQIGLMDSAYFAYWEETDWCWRAREAGYRCVYAPEAKIWHKGSSSSNKSSYIYFCARNMLWFVRRHASFWSLMIFACYFPFDLLLRSCVFLLLHRDSEEIKAFIRGTLDGLTISIHPPRDNL